MAELSEVAVVGRDRPLNRDVGDWNSVNTVDLLRTESEEELSLFSPGSGFESIMGGVEERASSSLSTLSVRGSRIPRLSRSSSLKDKQNRLNGEATVPPSKSNVFQSVERQRKGANPSISGLFRSSSFVTSRGMREIPSSPGGRSYGRSFTPLFPDHRTRKFQPPSASSYVSPYSKKAIAAERKSQSCAGVVLSRGKEMSPYFSPQIMRRTSQPVMSLHTPHRLSNSPTSMNDDEDDKVSEKSFGSVSSAHSCDVTIGIRKMSAGFWGAVGGKSRNIVHCSHAHEQDPDTYLTPTQRAARKIRELQSQLKNARKEVLEKDVKIRVLTRDLVQLRMKKAQETDHPQNTRDKKTPTKIGREKRREGENYEHTSSPRGGSPPSQLFLPCLTPTSDDSERELKILSRKRGGSTRSKDSNDASSKSENRNISPRHSPALVSVGGDSDSGDLSRSLADSGHYEDLPSPYMSSRDSLDAGFPSIRKIFSSICSSEGGECDTTMMWAFMGAAEEALRAEWARKVEQIKANHMEEYHELKERHNDKVEMLLSKLSEANLKYFELRPQHDKAQERVRELEREIDRLNDELRESEVRHQKVYLQMYLKGQQAAKLETEDKQSLLSSDETKETCGKPSSIRDLEQRDGSNQNGMIFSLMKQLAQSEDEIQRLKIAQAHERGERRARGSFASTGRREEIDPEVTLQFLKSAIYYFLTDRENSPGHLRVIESILGFSAAERGNISRSFRF